MTDPMAALARRTGTTPGQAWTLSLGLLLAAVLLGTSLPPVLDARGTVLPVAAAPPPADPGGALTGLVPVPPAVPAVPAAPAAPGVPAPLAPVAQPDVPVRPGPLLPAPALPDAGTASAPSSAPSPAPAPRPTAGPAGPLVVSAGGFSTTDPATPALPPDGLPVSARLGEQVEVAHVRLTGRGQVLALAVDSTVGTGEVQACRHTTADWTAARPQVLVPYDPDDCVTGVVTEGVIRFDLGDVPDRTSRAGFALAPVPSADPVPSALRTVLRPTDPGAPA